MHAYAGYGHKDAVTSNVLIAGYAEHSLVPQARVQIVCKDA